MNEQKRSREELEAYKAYTERMQFHWSIWKSECKSFWTRLTVSSSILLVLFLYQLGTVELNLPWFKVILPTSNKIYIVGSLYWFLLLIGFFSFVDLMRHRVPDEMENTIHNNEINIGHLEKKIDLKKRGRFLYLYVFTFYFLGFLTGFGFMIWYTVFGNKGSVNVYRTNTTIVWVQQVSQQYILTQTSHKCVKG